MRQDQNIYFMFFHPKDGSILHGIGIFRIHPDVVEVRVVENAGKLGELQQVRKR